MRTFSSPRTRNSKVTTPFAVIAVAMIIAAWVVRAEWATRPLYAAGLVISIALIGVFYLWRSGIWGLADSVVEGPEGLVVRRNDIEFLVTYPQIAAVSHRAVWAGSICALQLHSPGLLGAKIEFLPLSDEESVTQLGVDLWSYLESNVAAAQSGRAA